MASWRACWQAGDVQSSIGELEQVAARVGARLKKRGSAAGSCAQPADSPAVPIAPLRLATQAGRSARPSARSAIGMRPADCHR